jgi:hypothetical protein
VKRQDVEEVSDARIDRGATSAVSGLGSRFGIDMTREWNIVEGQKSSVDGFAPSGELMAVEGEEDTAGKPLCFPSGSDGGSVHEETKH